MAAVRAMSPAAAMRLTGVLKKRGHSMLTGGWRPRVFILEGQSIR